MLMKRTLLALSLFLFAGSLLAQSAPDAPQLSHLLNDFLAGAGRNDLSVHENFWADDLIYTTSKGQRKSKDDIIKEVRAEGAPKAGEPTTVFTAEDVQIHQYGDTAVVAFRLVGTTDDKGKKEVANYFNTGTFVKRDGKWQVVAWQATVIPKEDRIKP